MPDEIHTCTICDKPGLYDESCGSYCAESDTFECNTCYGKRADEEWAAYRDYAAIAQNYPDLDRHSAMQKADPVGFYLACKDGTI